MRRAERCELEVSKRRLTLALELSASTLEEAFRVKALVDVTCLLGVLLIKVAEALLGAQCAAHHAVSVVQRPPENQPTSTDRIEATLNALLADQRNGLAGPPAPRQPPSKDRIGELLIRLQTLPA
jgi:hypothetical protein